MSGVNQNSYTTKLIFRRDGLNLEYIIGENKFNENATKTEVVRYLKGIYRNKTLFMENFIKHFLEAPKKFKQKCIDENQPNDFFNPEDFECSAQMQELIDIYEMVTPFTIKEAFELKDDGFRIKVFGSINIAEMINGLGATRISVDGKPVKHKQYDEFGNFIGHKEYDVIYETYSINGEKLGIEDNDELCVVKCWCTTTNKEHFIWVDPKHKYKPLEAIASTFMVPRNIIPHIKELKRQGDILICEMNEKVDADMNDMVSLTSDQYFSLLTCQS